MASFLDRYAVDGRFGVAGGMLGRAKAAGFSDKQIATAITKYSGGLKIGQAIRPGSQQHTAMAHSTKGSPNNWIFNYMGGSGAVGWGGLQAALAAGKTREQLIAAGSMTSGGTQNYGVAGFGKKASEWLSQEPEEEPEAEPMFDIDPMNYTSAGSDVGSGATGVLARKNRRAGMHGGTSDLKRKNLLINKQLNV